jgi:hypothetical protein
MQTLPDTVIELERELLAPLLGRKGAELMLTWEDDHWQFVWCDGVQSRCVTANDLHGIVEAFRNYTDEPPFDGDYDPSRDM